jgi:hypothetical protein
LEVRQVGKFDGQIHLFVDDGGTREIILSVKGKTKASAKQPVNK